MSDPLHLDADSLRAVASEPVLRRGIAYFNEHRVIDLGFEPGRLWGVVSGSDPHLPYQVRIEADADGELEVTCDCPFDWEPACKHAVALLLAYADQQEPGDVDLRGASDAAVEDRARRGRAEVAVEHLEGDPWFGTWTARSIGHHSATRRVQIRSLSERSNHCSCPDFAVNLLGTCKHVEAVLHRLRKSDAARFEQLARTGPPVPVVTLAWDVPEPPRIRLVGRAHASPTCARHFDTDGLLRGALPEAFHRLQRDLVGEPGVQIGDDVLEHVRALAEADAQAARAARIRGEILRSGGRLEGVNARLYPYQVEGVAFLAATGRALLADDMGLGKTLQTLAAATWLVRHEGVQRVLVVTPASLKHQWKREIERFTDTDAVVVQGGPAARIAQYRRRAVFTIVNYEVVLRDAEVIQREIAPDLVVLDEAQRIKNWRTKTSARVKALQSRYAFVLTGTPLENRLEDLYSLMQVIDPRILGPLWRFLLEFHVVDERGKVLGYRNLTELRRRLAPVMLRRDRALVRDQLPERTEIRLDVPLDGRQRQLHDEALQAAASIASISKRRPLTPAEEKRMLAALQTARMACNATGLVDEEATGSPKLAELERLLEELCVEGGRKVVVFSQWERMTRLAEGVARGLGLGTVRLHGSVPTPARGALIERFETDPEVQVFLSTDAGGVGLNLQAASALLNLDLPWNPAVLDQRIARIHRLGQRERVQIVLLVGADCYEERIATLLSGKRELFRHAVTDEATEDVVGVSRRLVELAIDSLAADAPAEEPGATKEPDPAEPDSVEADALLASDNPAEAEVAPTVRPNDDARRLDHVIAALQDALGARIERIVASGGGLLVVVDRADDVARGAAEAVTDVPVAAVDAPTYAALRRLGATTGEPVWQRSAPPGGRWLAQARRKLEAAESLLAREFAAEAVECATRAMLYAVAERCEVDPPPELSRAALWVYGELVPQGRLGAEEAAEVGRAVALAALPEVPSALASGVVTDAARHVARASAP